MNERSRARTFAARLTASLLAIALVVVVLSAVAERGGIFREQLLARASGWVAAGALVAALAISPWLRLRTWLKKPTEVTDVPSPVRLAALRRALGIAAASCGLVHGAYALVFVVGTWPLLSSAPWLRAGLAALIALGALLVTSFDVFTRRLQLQHWKALHWLVFPASGLVLAHVILGPFGQPRMEMGLAGLLTALWTLRLIPGRPAGKTHEPTSKA
jgi:DMSO/TMAO reductase YedYZ heme-binding membrane subunit